MTQTHIDEFQLKPLRLGPEIEYPGSPESRTTWTKSGREIAGVRDRVRDRFGTSRRTTIGPHQTMFGSDPTVGPEIRPDTGDGIVAREVSEWYDTVVDIMEHDFGEPMEPVGRMESNTAGLHIHLSPLAEETAQRLYEWSQEPWMQVFVCSTLVDWDDPAPTTSVVRDRHSNYLRFRGTDMRNVTRYNAVHMVGSPSSGHYEWRLPEPMMPAHFELVVEFLRRLYNDGPDEARQYAMDLVTNADERLTAVRRAREIGLVDSISLEDGDDLLWTTSRTPSMDTSDFFTAVRSADSAPYIYRVRRGEMDYYVFVSPNDAVWTEPNSGIDCHDGMVIRADDLTVPDGSVVQEIWEAFDSRSSGPTNTPPDESAATELLADRLLSA
jgi:hypothetical protein